MWLISSQSLGGAIRHYHVMPKRVIQNVFMFNAPHSSLIVFALVILCVCYEETEPDLFGGISEPKNLITLGNCKLAKYACSFRLCRFIHSLIFHYMTQGPKIEIHSKMDMSVQCFFIERRRPLLCDVIYPRIHTDFFLLLLIRFLDFGLER
jgi:hypothetical protein